jgi:hypothetical protein
MKFISIKLLGIGNISREHKMRQPHNFQTRNTDYSAKNSLPYIPAHTTTKIKKSSRMSRRYSNVTLSQRARLHVLPRPLLHVLDCTFGSKDTKGSTKKKPEAKLIINYTPESKARKYD